MATGSIGSPRREPLAAAYPRADATTSLRNLRLLVVDDDADTRDALAAALASCESEVKVAASAADALATLRTWRPDVLLSDISLPGEDGYTLIRRVRALGSNDGGRTPAVALTGFSRSEDRIRLMAAGFQTHVVKPVEMRELTAVIAAVARGAVMLSSADAVPSARVGLNDGEAPSTEPGLDPLATSVSHELRQPLFAMRLWLKVLEAELAGTLTTQGRAHVAHLRASIAAMDDIIQRRLEKRD